MIKACGNIKVIAEEDWTIGIECQCGWSDNLGREATIPELSAASIHHLLGGT